MTSRSPTDDIALANAWLALGQAYAPPHSWDPGIADRLAVALGAGRWRTCPTAAALSEQVGAAQRDRGAAALAHARLFVGPFEIRAPAYASLYLDPERRLMGAVSDEAARFYAQAGLVPGEGPRDAPDHLQTELEFIYYLHYQELQTGEARWFALRRAFWFTHLSRWLRPMVKAMRGDPVHHPLYEALAAFTIDTADGEDAALRSRVGVPPER